MPEQEKQRLIRLLKETLSDTLAVLERVDDYNAVAHSDSGWRVKDVIGHMAAWDHEAAAALRAFSRGEEYHIPGYAGMEGYNWREYEKRKELDAERVVAGWREAYKDMQSALDEVPLDKMRKRFRFPWGAWGTVTAMIEVMVGHERWHWEEILKVMQP